MRPSPSLSWLLAAGCGNVAGGQRSAGERTAPTVSSLVVNPFDAPIYGASGVAQLADGRLIVAGDDQYNPLTIIDLFGTGASKTFTSREIGRALGAAGGGPLNDLEALATDGRGHVYATTSHALTSKAVEKPSREQLVRFDVVRNRLVDVRVSTRLKPALVKLDSVFATAAAEEPHEHGGLNIEGIAWDPSGNRLLLGFRSPRRHRHALVVWLQNPDGVFDRSEEPVLLPAIDLDLEGEGIRDVTYSSTLSSFVIVAGTWRRGKHTPTTLVELGRAGGPACEAARAGLRRPQSRRDHGGPRAGRPCAADRQRRRECRRAVRARPRAGTAGCDQPLCDPPAQCGRARQPIAVRRCLTATGSRRHRRVLRSPIAPAH